MLAPAMHRRDGPAAVACRSAWLGASPRRRHRRAGRLLLHYLAIQQPGVEHRRVLLLVRTSSEVGVDDGGCSVTRATSQVCLQVAADLAGSSTSASLYPRQSRAVRRAAPDSAAGDAASRASGEEQVFGRPMQEPCLCAGALISLDARDAFSIRSVAAARPGMTGFDYVSVRDCSWARRWDVALR